MSINLTTEEQLAKACQELQEAIDTNRHAIDRIIVLQLRQAQRAAWKRLCWLVWLLILAVSAIVAAIIDPHGLWQGVLYGAFGATMIGNFLLQD